jgi:hypothetical protein
MQYTVVIEESVDGSYGAYVPDLPGCISCGWVAHRFSGGGVDFRNHGWVAHRFSGGGVDFRLGGPSLQRWGSRF